MFADVLGGKVVGMSWLAEFPKGAPKGKWLRVVEQNKEHDPVVQQITGPKVSVESDRVWHIYVVSNRPDALLRQRTHVYSLAQEIYEGHSSNLSSGYTKNQIDTFSQQRREADLYILSPDSDTPMLDRCHLARGIEKSVLVEKIVKKSTLLSLASGHLLGRLSAIEDALANADMDEVERIKREEISIGWDYLVSV